jgi:hypothetical protein
MEFKFKIGDRVKRINGLLWGMHEGDEGTVTKVGEWHGQEWIAIREFSSHDDCYDDRLPFRAANFAIVSGKTKPEEQPKFILQYERDTDPFELFSTEKELRAHVKELAADPTVKRDSIKVYDIKRTRTVTLGVKITIK